MKERGNKLVWFLGALVLLLSCALVVQTAYMVWLHRQLYVAVAGTGSSLHELEKLLNTEIGLSGDVAKETRKDAPPEQANRDLLGGGSLGDLRGIHEEAERVVNDALKKDPGLRDLLGDLGYEAPEEPAPAVPPETFNPTFDYREAGDRYIVTVALPGVRERDVQATVKSGVVSVSGTRAGAAFRESFAFPGPVVAGSEKIVFKNGRLTVSARKADSGPGDLA